MFDVAIVGGGPAGASCAAFCAQVGLRVVLLEREKFPREKVCGDCVNPSCWPVFRRLAIESQVRALPHARLGSVEFIGVRGQSVSVALPESGDDEIAVKRSLLDSLLLSRTKALGAHVCEDSTITALEWLGDHGDPSARWAIAAGGNTFEARILVGADGRNSTVARLRNLLPRPARERVALQTHIPAPSGFGSRVVLQFLPEGYSGQAPVGSGELNLCLVGKPHSIVRLKEWADRQFGIRLDHSWRTITPLTRQALPATQPNLLLVGDAARVVEPFTGEGIFYAVRSGELAAQAIERMISGAEQDQCRRDYEAALRDMYAGRLWLNQVARAMVLAPAFGSTFVGLARRRPAILGFLTSKIVRAG